MADYWKSTAKKYCKLCDVWYADNRISIENHERGLKHKGMLEKHLRDMSKREKQREAAVR
jgi:WW domain-binding protein 4